MLWKLTSKSDSESQNSHKTCHSIRYSSSLPPSFPTSIQKQTTTSSSTTNPNPNINIPPFPASSPPPSDQNQNQTNSNNSNSNLTTLTNPTTITATIFLTSSIWLISRIYRTYLRRYPNATAVHSSYFRNKNKSIFGLVNSVGDGDGFRVFHTPGGRLMGWGLLPWKKVPDFNKRRGKKDDTVGFQKKKKKKISFLSF